MIIIVNTKKIKFTFNISLIGRHGNQSAGRAIKAQMAAAEKRLQELADNPAIIESMATELEGSDTFLEIYSSIKLCSKPFWKLRIGQTRKNPKCPVQLFTRPYATVPYMGRGSGNSYVESQLRPGEATAEKKQCNTLAGITIPNVDPNAMPMIDHIRNSIQNILNEILEWKR